MQLHLGGGTPNFLDARQMAGAFQLLRSNDLDLTNGIQYNDAVISPGGDYTKNAWWNPSRWKVTDNPDGNPDFRIDDGEPVKIIGRAVWMGAKL